MKKLLLLSLAIAMGLSGSGADAREPRTAEMVIATDDAWLQAEIRDDGAALLSLLLPDYRSVGVDGKITTAAELVSRAERRGAAPATAAAVRAWRQTHPVQPRVRIFGDTAILTWELSSEAGAKVSSCDIFVDREGHWRAAYSQHSNASG